ncbi:uncharacterized protein LY79DRAFT_342580 [Colletotrichum navitas]|uniref:Uncharacterized protein n=1 Tax=Colletotrichum navitas TaxID=681940 RepID=A0AAD8PSY1_9PEZI|nr:uncharacterized protein LY79DRAFT_342580 [Colletotrichum navitas]KAK1579448.1 hypothetical protein LY79DRAFT_342580 [Colletotrichum navitas]
MCKRPRTNASDRVRRDDPPPGHVNGTTRLSSNSRLTFPTFHFGRGSRDSGFGVCTCSQPIHAFLCASQIWKSGDGQKAGGSLTERTTSDRSAGSDAIRLTARVEHLIADSMAVCVKGQGGEGDAVSPQQIRTAHIPPTRPILKGDPCFCQPASPYIVAPGQCGVRIY